MTENNPSTPDRKSRREALSLLLGTALLGSAACSQPEKPPTDENPPDDQKDRPVTIVLEDKGNFDPMFDKQHLSQSRSDILIVVNIGSETVLFQVDDSPFDKSCEAIESNKKAKFKIRDDVIPTKQCKFHTKVGENCNEFAPESVKANGDIIIDP